MSKMSPLAKEFFDRVAAAVSAGFDLTHLSEWLERNTRSPSDSNLPWSFFDHEFQIDILNDPASWVACRKPSQVGLSELVVRMTLAMMGIFRNTTAIYTLPTSGFAAEFAKSRFDPVIEASPALSRMIDKDNDSSKLKKLGTNFLYIRGTFTQKAAISIPASILVNDEIDFSDQTALTTFSSRLGHNREGASIRREFSTPTVNGYGISASFENSTQAHRGVRCDSCHEMVFPSFFDDVVIPGYDDEIIKFEVEDLRNPRYRVKSAFLSCPKCHNVISNYNLRDPEKREWVKKYADKEISGYQVMPFDVPSINPVSRTISQMSEYKRKADWVNFKVGLPYEDAETSFLVSTLENSIGLRPKEPPKFEYQGSVTDFIRPIGMVLGCDVGKTSHIVIGIPQGRGKLSVVWMERFKISSSGSLLSRLVFLTRWFGVSKGVIDAGPDFTTSMGYVEAFNLGRTFANYYVRAQAKSTLSHIQIKDEEGIVNTVRTESFDLLAKKSNAGNLELPKSDETAILIEHLGNLKRVETKDSKGDTVASWVNTGPDHYGHALNYANIAASLMEDRFKVAGVVGVLPMASSVPVKQMS